MHDYLHNDEIGEGVSLKVFMIAVLVIAYAIFPDLFPGPIDDLLVMIIGGWAARKQFDAE